MLPKSPLLKWGPKSNPTPTWVADLPVSKLNFIGVGDEEEEREEGRDVWEQKKHPFSKQNRSTKFGITAVFRAFA